MFDDGEAEASAADLARACAVRAVKSLEYTLGMLRQNALACVRDRYYILSVNRFAGDGYTSAVAVKFDRVIDEIRQHLFEPNRICKNDRAFRNLVF